MRAVVIDRFGAAPVVREVEDPDCPPDGVVVAVAASGLCRSDWHGWIGHDPDIRLPHVPGHEFAGTIVEVGRAVTRWAVGDRITTPFVCACGRCATCVRGDQQVCENQQQPGFTHWGSFAEYVVADVADVNAVALPDHLGFDAAASLGCRFATAYRAVTVHGRITPGEQAVVHGCGGVGLSAVMVAVADGAQVIAVDPSPAARERALGLGASAALDPSDAATITELTGGGADVSFDAIGGVESLTTSVHGLRRRGRHVQIGLMGAATHVPAAVVSRVVSHELEFLGSHGMAAHEYPAMLARVGSGELDLDRLIRRRIGLGDVAAELATLDTARIDGITLVVPSPG